MPGYTAPMRVLYLLLLLGLLTLLGGICPLACSSTSSQPCNELTEEAQTAIGFDEAEAGVDLSCKSASDCVVVETTTACWPSCSVVLTQAGASSLKAAIAQINATTCATFASDSCPANPPPTCSTLAAACVNGTCAVATSEDAGPGEDANPPPSEDAGTDAGDAASPEDAGVDAGDSGCPCLELDGSTDGASDGSDAAED
jgi:hypothetical protein